MERITVLIANKNYGKYLEKAIESAINQTVKPQCICVIDDFSDDNSWEIISQLCKIDPQEEQTLITPQGNILLLVGRIWDIDILGVKLPVTSGPSVARNIGIQFTMPSTDYFLILDADDEALPNKIEELLIPMNDERVGVTYANYYNVSNETGMSILEVKEPYSQLRLFQECIVHSGSLIRASALNSIGNNGIYYDPNLRTCEDWDLWIRLSKLCMFYHVPLALTNVLVHSQNSTNSVAKETWQRNWAYISQKHFGGQ